jgi:mannitol-1-phosphate 5-dehydrogenase
MKTKIILIGAGAIGRGYLPWTLDLEQHDLVFVDSNPEIVDHLNNQGGYNTYRVKDNEYQQLYVTAFAAYLPQAFCISDYQDAAVCFFSVGPRNVAKAAQLMKGSSVPLIICENEPEAVNVAKSVVEHDNVFFAVPDVITSNTAPQHLLTQDPLAIVTESGTLYVESGPEGVHGEMDLISCEELLRIQWTLKLFLHNTPHCIAAYLGALMRVTYVHEAMEEQFAAKLVESVMNEMLQTLKLQWSIPHDFLEWYAQKELARFRCQLLFDPVARVAREPLRKLELHGRLIGAAQMCLSHGVLPQNLLKGIVAAVLFEDENDPDHHIGLMREAINTAQFNRYVLGLRSGEPLDLLLRDQIEAITLELHEMTKKGKVR